jgi:hypothetical protein
MHRRSYNPASILIPSLIQGEVAQSDLGLPSVPQDIDCVAIRHDHSVLRRRMARDQNLTAAGIICHFRYRRLIVGENGQRQLPLARQLKSVVLIPW